MDNPIVLRSFLIFVAASLSIAASGADYDPFEEILKKDPIGNVHRQLEFRSTSSLASCLTVQFLLNDIHEISPEIVAKAALNSCKEELYEWYRYRPLLPDCMNDSKAASKTEICVRDRRQVLFKDLPYEEDISDAIELLREVRMNKDASKIRRTLEASRK